MTDTPDLLPCPCCGGEAEVDTARGFWSFPERMMRDEAAIYCLECNLEVSCTYENCTNDYMQEQVQKEIIAQWNTRTDDPMIAAAPDMYAALVTIAGKINPGDDSPNDYWTDLDGADVEAIFEALAKARGET